MVPTVAVFSKKYLVRKNSTMTDDGPSPKKRRDVNSLGRKRKASDEEKIPPSKKYRLDKLKKNSNDK